MLNATFVVPTTQAQDSTHFYNLQSAINNAGPSGTVTIEPGSAVQTATVTSSGVLIQGDPNVSPASLPNDGFTINPGAGGTILQHLNLSFVDIFDSNVSVLNSVVTGEIFGLNAAFGGPAGSSDSNLTISGNTYSGDTTALLLFGSTGDTISANTFNANNLPTPTIPPAPPATNPTTATPVIELFSGGGNILSSNTINASGTDFLEGISLINQNNDSILSNTISLTTVYGGTLNTRGIDIHYTAAASSSITVANNRITTGNIGMGLFINTTTNTDANVKVDVYGNDFHNNEIGVYYVASGGAPGSDLGGGPLGSAGNNNFRGFTGNGSPTYGAVVVNGTLTSALSAQNNLFANNINPANVVFSSTTVNTGSAITGTPAFVQVSFSDLLGRSASSSEVSFWSSVYTTFGQGAAVTGILTSTEGFNHLVNNLYLQFLGRQADTFGLSYWTFALQHGATLEEVEAGILSSQEFLTRAGGSNYVQDLYLTLLGRTAGSFELAYWNAILSSPNGQLEVALGILSSSEYRADYVQSLYQTYLHRSASSAELAFWVNLPATGQQLAQQKAVGDLSPQLNLLGVEEGILSSTEYYNNG